MNKKLCLIIPLLATLAACGGGESSASSSIASSSASSSAESGEVVVPFWTTFGQKNGEALKKKAEDFSAIIEKETGKKVTINTTYEGGYDDIRNKITQGFSAGNIPTMAIAYPDHVANYLTINDGEYVYDIEDFIKDPEIGLGKQKYLGDEGGEEDFVEAFIDEGRHYAKDGTFSMPLMKSSEVLFYNMSAVRSIFKIAHPEITGDDNIRSYMSNLTWDEFIEFAQIAVDHKVISTLDFPIWYDSDSNLLISKLYQEKIGYCSIDDNGKGKIDFESGESREKAEAFVSSLVDAHNKHLLTTKGVENTYGSDAFTNGKSIFEIGSSGGTGYNDPEFAYGVCKVPVSNNNPLFVSQGPTLTFLKNPAISEAQNAERMKYAWQFAKYITNASTNVYLCVYGSEGYLPVKYSAYDTPEFVDFLENGEIYAASAKVLINDIDGAYFNAPVFKGSADLRDQCGGIVTGALLGNKGTVTELFDAAISNAKKGF